MRYADQYDQAGEDVEQMNVRIVKWGEVGDTVIGKLLEVGKLEDSQYDSDPNRYVMETDHGLVSFLLGTATDKSVEESGIEPGDLLRIEFLGQREIGGGRTVNEFDVERFGHEEV